MPPNRTRPCLRRSRRLTLRNVEGRLHIARKERRHDEWDLPIAPYDPTGRHR